MKTIKLVSLLATALFAFWACHMGGEEEPDPTEELLGTWESDSFEGEVLITTNSDQTILDRDSEGVGAIEVSGADSASLTYITEFYSDGHSTYLTVSNRSRDSREYPMHSLNLNEYEGDRYINYSIGTENDYRNYESDKGDFSFENFILTISETKLYRFEYDPQTVSLTIIDSVTTAGTLTGSTIDIPANTPTSFPMPDYAEDQFRFTLKLKESDTYVLIMADGYSITGVWEVEDGMLNLYPSEGEIMSFSYTLSDNNLTLELEEDLCRYAKGDPQEYDSCLKYNGMEYGLGAGSLDSIVNHIILELSR